jgi:hypothetical protein
MLGFGEESLRRHARGGRVVLLCAIGRLRPIRRPVRFVHPGQVARCPWGAFKMHNYLGSRRLQSGCGTGGDGINVVAAMSAGGDEVQVLVYNYHKTVWQTRLPKPTRRPNMVAAAGCLGQSKDGPPWPGAAGH